MICVNCAKSIPDSAGFCSECGQQVTTSIVTPDTSTPVFVASLKYLKCPSCGSSNFIVTGEKGAFGKALATGAAFGAIGNMVAGNNATKNFETPPLQYKCNDCSKKFVSPPLPAAPEEILSTPCTITFERLSSFVGAVVPQIVYINGVKVGAVKNGKSITFHTNAKYNIIFVTDQYGVAFKSDYRFEAQPGSSVTVRFNRVFK